MPVAEHVEQRADLQVGEEGMPQMGLPVDLVAVAAPFLDPHEKPLGNEVGDDLLGSPLADPDAGCNVTDPDGRLARNAQEHVAVVREHEPGRTGSRLVDRRLLKHGS